MSKFEEYYKDYPIRKLTAKEKYELTEAIQDLDFQPTLESLLTPWEQYELDQERGLT